ncbi:helix-turn-helix domain-containing protein [Actinoplanes subtropicus]|uniref:helix-turn-helix transcriptional regulator n=1 Tax=Actinoplanes subtropicus TaxID=543632 RepID=UPI001B7FF580
MARQARRWTPDRLAKAIGVSRRILVEVEYGTTNPSVGTLRKTRRRPRSRPTGVGRNTPARAR